MPRKSIYKVIFHSQGKIYEIYARGVSQSDMYGFIDVEKLVFGENTSLLVDPSEEQLKSEFEGVNRTSLPMHSIIRIDEVDREGHGKITSAEHSGDNVMPFGAYTQTDTNKAD